MNEIYQLQSLEQSLERQYQIVTRINGFEWDFQYEERDDFDCVCVHINDAYSDLFLLRTDGEMVWYGKHGVSQKREELHQAGKVYYRYEDNPTEWVLLDIKTRKNELISLIQDVIKLGK